MGVYFQGFEERHKLGQNYYEVLRAVCALMNTKGGLILVGISKKKRVVGMACSDGKIEDYVTSLRELFSKKIKLAGKYSISKA